MKPIRNPIKIFFAAALTAILFLAVHAQAADKQKVVYQFHKASGGNGPDGGLYMDPAANLFGLTDSGLLFELTPNGSGGWNYSNLATSLCGYPAGPLVRDHAGNFYNTSYFGWICEFSPASSGGWSSSIIYTLNSVRGEASSLVVDAAGNLYGVNGLNGANGFGFVFELSPTSAGGWSLTDLYDFKGTDGNADSSGNVGGLTLDAAGNLYGVTWAGGSNPKCAGQCGVVFKLTNNAGVWSETVLHNFGGASGAYPDSALLLDSAGNLYGTTTAGGASGFGVVFEISAASGQTRVLHSFTNKGGDGAYPQTPLVMDAAGNLYGTTTVGGLRGGCSVGSIQGGCGIAFELSPVGNQWKEFLLHDFGGLADGAFPSGFVLGANGNLYADAPSGGSEQGGLVFEIVP